MTVPDNGNKTGKIPTCNNCTNLAIAAILVWTAIIGSSALWNIHLVRQGTVQLARAEAVCSLEKDLVYRRWVAKHGGVYVPVTEETNPNPYLTQTRERDITTPSGRVLTLINPAYMTRQVHEMGSDIYGVRGHVTSLSPLRPGNAPDQWEKQALQEFAKTGASEFSAVVNNGGIPRFRMMRPLVAKRECLSCHTKNGYKTGDILGGLSVSVPMVTYLNVARANLRAITFGHGVIWILGLFGIGFARSTHRKRLHEQKQAKELLNESEQRLADVVNFLPDATFVIDEKRTVIVWNRAIEEMTGILAADMIGRGDHEYMIPFYGERRKHLADLVWDHDPELEARYPYIRKEGGSIISEIFCQPLNNGEGAHLFLMVSPLHDKFGRVVGAIESIRDISDLKLTEKSRLQFERRFQQTQKLESLGVLAGGIAHDFNNILMAVMGCANLALTKLPPTSPAREWVEGIEKASHRAAELCRQMLDYSGKGRFVIEPVILGELILEMVDLLKTSISKKAILNLDLADKLPPISGDAGQLRQVVMNLVINASEALGDENGVITVATGSKKYTSARLAEMQYGEDLPEGLYTWIQVTDTGCGMSEEIRNRIFEPFFTTKFTGRGLGLAAVQGIVRGHGGALTVDSEVGKGTTFTVLLPAANDEPGSVESKPNEGSNDWQGAGTVLLVDDDESIRIVGKEMLEHIGFRAETAGDGCEAMNLFRGREKEIDLVLLDLTMPCMDGIETLRELRCVNPDVRVVISSGYAEHDIASRFAENAPNAFIQKPYNLENLKECLKDALK